MRQKKQGECQAQPRKEEKRSGATRKLQKTHCGARRTGQAAREAFERALSPLKGPKEAEPITIVREHDVEEPIEGDEGQPEHQTADDANH